MLWLYLQKGLDPGFVIAKERIYPTDLVSVFIFCKSQGAQYFEW